MNGDVAIDVDAVKPEDLRDSFEGAAPEWVDNLTKTHADFADAVNRVVDEFVLRLGGEMREKE